MELEISKYFPGVKPNVTLPLPKILEILGEDGMRNLVSDFYDLLVKIV